MCHSIGLTEVFETSSYQNDIEPGVRVSIQHKPSTNYSYSILLPARDNYILFFPASNTIKNLLIQNLTQKTKYSKAHRT